MSRHVLLLASFVASLCLASSSQAQVMTFGSPLSVPATLNTSEDLAYPGSNVSVPGQIVHINHDGADTALWNASLASGSPTAPLSGQVTQLRLEGCAEPAPRGPAPLTQIHFQVLARSPDGSFTADLTSGAFDIPVCGDGGTSGSTISTFTPVNLCVHAGDYVDFADEGGFSPSSYPSGVPYEVMGAVSGSTMDSFIRGGGVNNGSVFSPSDSSYHDGFAQNPQEELMLQATLATGADATPICGGQAGVKPKPQTVPLFVPAHQRDGINVHHGTSIALFCNLHTTCRGSLTLSLGRAKQTVAFVIPSKKTSHVKITLSRVLLKAFKHRRQANVVVLVAIPSYPSISSKVLLYL